MKARVSGYNYFLTNVDIFDQLCAMNGGAEGYGVKSLTADEQGNLDRGSDTCVALPGLHNNKQLALEHGT